MEDVAVETATDDAGTPPVVDGASAESGTPPVDAQAGTEGGTPAGGEVEPLLTYLQSKGFQSLDDPAARAALHDNIRKAQNDNSQFSKRIKELEAELAQRATPAAPAEPEPEPEVHPDIKGLDEYISSLKAELEAVPQTEATLVKDLWTLNTQIAIAEHDAKRADEMDKPAANAEVARLKGEQRLVQRQLDALPTDRKRLEFHIRSAETQKTAAERAIQAEERARQEAGESQKTWEANLVTEVNTLIPRIADELNLLKDTKDAALRQSMAEDVYEGLMADLWARANANIKEVNIQELIRARVDKWGKKHGLVQAAKLAQLSKEKTPVAGKPNAVPSKTVPANAPPKELSIYERLDQERAERMKKLAALGLG
jgi:hypothetical protein